MPERKYLIVQVRRRDCSTVANAAGPRVLKGEKIGKVEVNEEAIATISSKLEALKVDSAGEREILESYLSVIRKFAYNEHRTNAFLVAKDELEQHPQERQAIRELVDLRLIHLIDSNTSSAPSDGRRYEAYISMSACTRIRARGTSTKLNLAQKIPDLEKISSVRPHGWT